MLTETLEARQLLAAGDAVQLVDDADADFSTTGTFNPNSGGFNSGIKQSHFNWTASTASWTFDVSPGTYEVAASWPGKSNSASDAPFSVLDGVGGSVLGTVSMDQTAEPDDFVDENVGWESLGSFTVTGNSIEVQLSNAVTAGYAIADVVRIQRVAPVSLSEAQLGAVADKAHVGFGITGVGQLVDKAFTLTNDSAAAITLDPIVAPQGFSIVNNFTAGQTLSAGASVNFTVRLDASAASKSYGPLSIVVDDGAESLLELTISGTTLAAGSAVQVVDDSDVGFYHSGTFYSISGGGLNGAMQHSHPSWRDSLARWVVDVEPGTYEVAATWPSSSARAIDAPFTIYDGVGGSVLATSVVDQTDAPREFVEAGTAWDSLGEVTATGNTLVIEVSNDSTTGYSIADAVRVQRLAGVSVSEATLGNVAQGDHVGFGVTEVGSPVEKTFTLSNDSADPVLLAPITAATGFTVVNNFQSSQSLPAGQTIDFTVRLDAGADAKSFGRLEMVIEDDAAALFDFGISGTVTSSAVQEVGRFDDGFVSAGKFQMVAVGHFGSAMKTHVSYEGSRVYWVVDVQPGEYEVAVSWPGFSGNAPDAPFTVYDGVGGAALETIAVDQTGDANDFVDGLTGWKVLGDYTITGNTLMIDVTNAIASGFAVADAVRVQRLSGVTLSDAFGVPIGNGKHFGFGAVEEGRIVSKTFTLTNDSGDSIELSPVAVPAGFTVVNNFTAGQVLSAGSSVDFTVQFDGTTETKAYGELSIEIDAGGPSLFWNTISGTSLAAPGTLQYLDNDETGFLKAGFFTVGAGAYGTDQNHALASWQGSRAIWVFDVQPGTYRVAATWLPASIYAPNTPFTVYDGVEGEPLGTATFDQTVAPDDLSDAGVDWELILGEFDITGNTLMVNLTNVVANGYAAADAIRIERIEDPPGDRLDQAKVVSLQPNVPAEVTATIGNGLFGEADVDLFEVNLTAGQILKADVDAFYLDDGTWGSLLDSYLKIFDASGTELAVSDVGSAAGDETNDLDAYLSVTAPVTGTYYVGVTGAGNVTYDPNQQGTGTTASTGDYTLQLLATDTATTPTVSGLADLTIDENSGSHNVTFTVGDPDTPLDDLTTRYISSNPALIDVPSGLFSGTTASRTVSIAPIDDQLGTATVTVIVADGTESISDSFVVTVDPVNPESEIASVRLAHDSGTPDDLSTAIPIVDGHVLRRASEAGLQVEWDHDDNEIAEATVDVDPVTFQFQYDPRVTEPTFAATTGPVELHYRLALPRAGMTTLYGDWQPFDFSIEVAPPSPLSTDNVEVDVFQTSATDHGLTYRGEISGDENLGESTASSIVVEVDTDGDFQSDDSVAVANLADGFTYTPASPNFASHTISFRLVHQDSYYQSQRAGSWNSLVFDPEEVPTITDVSLREDTGFSSTDGVTADPVIVGSVLGPVHSSSVSVEMDVDGDDVIDLTATVDSAGAFEFAPYQFTIGTVDVRVRAVDGPVTGDWTDFSFDYQPHDPPALSSFGLLVDDGVADDDAITSVAMVTGTFTTSFGDPQEVEIDLGNDGSIDATAAATDGLFFFEIPSPAAGTQTIGYRPARWNPYLAQTEYGNWETFSFEYAPVTTQLVGFESLGLRNDTGADDTDLVTTDPTIVGRVDVEEYTTVKIDLDPNNPDVAIIQTGANGEFTFTPTGLAAGLQTVLFSVSTYDHLTQSVVDSAWVPFTFTLEDAVNEAPAIDSLQLLSDSGTGGDGFTENPTVFGYVTNDGSVDGLAVEVDVDSDGIGDQVVFADADGRFQFTPLQARYGLVDLSVWAVEYDASTQSNLSSTVANFSFTYEDQVDEPPKLSSLSFDTGEVLYGVEPKLIGLATDQHLVAGVRVEVDATGDGIVDYTSVTDDEGRFEIGLAELTDGTTSISVRASAAHPIAKQLHATSWQTLNVNYQVSDVSTLPAVVITEIGLANDTGDDDADLLTTDPRLVGLVDRSSAVRATFVDFEIAGVSVGSTMVDADLRWSFVPAGLATGSVTIDARTRELLIDGQDVLGDWTSFTFTLQSPVDPTAPAAQAGHQTSIQAADTQWQTSRNGADTTYTGAIDIANTNQDTANQVADAQFQQGLRNADAAFSSGLSTAAANFQTALNNFSGDTTSFAFEAIEWPDAPRIHSVQIPDDADQATPPRQRPDYVGPQYDFDSDLIYQVASAQAKATYDFGVERAEEVRTAKDSDATALYDQQVAAAEAKAAVDRGVAAAIYSSAVQAIDARIIPSAQELGAYNDAITDANDDYNDATAEASLGPDGLSGDYSDDIEQGYDDAEDQYLIDHLQAIQDRLDEINADPPPTPSEREAIDEFYGELQLELKRIRSRTVNQVEHEQTLRHHNYTLFRLSRIAAASRKAAIAISTADRKIRESTMIAEYRQAIDRIDAAIAWERTTATIDRALAKELADAQRDLDKSLAANEAASRAGTTKALTAYDVAEATAKKEAMARWNTAVASPWTQYQLDLAANEVDYFVQVKSASDQHIDEVTDAQKLHDERIADAVHQHAYDMADEQYTLSDTSIDAREDYWTSYADQLHAQQLASSASTEQYERNTHNGNFSHSKRSIDLSYDYDNEQTDAELDRRISRIDTRQRYFHFIVLPGLERDFGMQYVTVADHEANRNPVGEIGTLAEDFSNLVTGLIETRAIEQQQEEEFDALNTDFQQQSAETLRVFQKAVAQAKRDHSVETTRIEGDLQQAYAAEHTIYVQATTQDDKELFDAEVLQLGLRAIADANSLKVFQQAEASEYASAMNQWHVQVDSPWSALHVAQGTIENSWATASGDAEVDHATAMHLANLTRQQQTSAESRDYRIDLATAEQVRTDEIADETDLYAVAIADAKLVYAKAVADHEFDYRQAQASTEASRREEERTFLGSREAAIASREASYQVDSESTEGDYLSNQADAGSNAYVAVESAQEDYWWGNITSAEQLAIEEAALVEYNQARRAAVNRYNATGSQQWDLIQEARAQFYAADQARLAEISRTSDLGDAASLSAGDNAALTGDRSGAEQNLADSILAATILYAGAVGDAEKAWITTTSNLDSDFTIAGVPIENGYLHSATSAAGNKALDEAAAAAGRREGEIAARGLYEAAIYADHAAAKQAISIASPSPLAVADAAIAAADAAWFDSVRIAGDAYQDAVSTAESNRITQRNAADLNLVATTNLADLQHIQQVAPQQAIYDRTVSHASVDLTVAETIAVATYEKDVVHAEANFETNVAAAIESFYADAGVHAKNLAADLLPLHRQGYIDAAGDWQETTWTDATALGPYSYDGLENGHWAFVWDWNPNNNSFPLSYAGSGAGLGTPGHFPAEFPYVDHSSPAQQQAYQDDIAAAEATYDSSLAAIQADYTTTFGDEEIARITALADAKVTLADARGAAGQSFVTTINTAESALSTVELAQFAVQQTAIADAHQVRADAVAAATKSQLLAGDTAWVAYRDSEKTAGVIRDTSAATAEAAYQQSVSDAEAQRALAIAVSSSTNPFDAYQAAYTQAKADWIDDVALAFITHATDTASAQFQVPYDLAVARQNENTTKATADETFAKDLAQYDRDRAVGTVNAANTRTASLLSHLNTRRTKAAENMAAYEHDVAVAEKQYALDLAAVRKYTDLNDFTHGYANYSEGVADADLAYATAIADAALAWQLSEGTAIVNYSSPAVTLQHTFETGIAGLEQTRSTNIATADKTRGDLHATAEGVFRTAVTAAENARRSSLTAADVTLWNTQETARVTAHTSIDTDLQSDWSQYLVDAATARASWWTTASVHYTNQATDRNSANSVYAGRMQTAQVDRRQADVLATKIHATAAADAVHDRAVARADSIRDFHVALALPAETYADGTAQAIRDRDVGNAQAERDFVFSGDATQHAADLQTVADDFAADRQTLESDWLAAEANQQADKYTDLATSNFDQSLDLIAADIQYETTLTNSEAAYADEESNASLQATTSWAAVDATYRQYEANTFATTATALSGTNGSPWAAFDADYYATLATRVTSVSGSHQTQMVTKAGAQKDVEIAHTGAETTWHLANVNGSGARATALPTADQTLASQLSADYAATGGVGNPLPEFTAAPQLQDEYTLQDSARLYFDFAQGPASFGFLAVPFTDFSETGLFNNLPYDPSLTAWTVVQLDETFWTGEVEIVEDQLYDLSLEYRYNWLFDNELVSESTPADAITAGYDDSVSTNPFDASAFDTRSTGSGQANTISDGSAEVTDGTEYRQDEINQILAAGRPGEAASCNLRECLTVRSTISDRPEFSLSVYSDVYTPQLAEIAALDHLSESERENKLRLADLLKEQHEKLNPSSHRAHRHTVGDDTSSLAATAQITGSSNASSSSITDGSNQNIVLDIVDGGVGAAQGFVKGFFGDGLKGNIEFAGSLLNWIYTTNLVGIIPNNYYAAYAGGPHGYQQAWDAYAAPVKAIKKTIDAARQYGPIAIRTASDMARLFSSDYLNALADGNHSKVAGLTANWYRTASPETLLVLDMVDPVVKTIVEELDSLTIKEKAHLIGRVNGLVTFEVLLSVATSGAGTAVKAGKVSEFLYDMSKFKFVTKYDSTGKITATLQKFADRLAIVLNTRVCFVAGTLVSTAEGFKPIEELKVGDLVLTRNEFADGEETDNDHQPVTELITTHPSELLELTLSDGESEETLTTTANHPFYSLDTKSFVHADQLEESSRVASADGQPLTVTAISRRAASEGETFTTYNIEVAGSHTYFVGRQRAWVHNTSTPCKVAMKRFTDVLDELGESADKTKAAEEMFELLRSMEKSGDIQPGSVSQHFNDALRELANPKPPATPKLTANEVVEFSKLAPKKLLSGAIRKLAEQNIRNSGKSVLGPFSPLEVNYINKADVKNASYFDIGKAWNKLNANERWAANQHFLDIVADSGDQVYLSIPKGKIRPDSYLKLEIDHLTRIRGYVWLNQWSLVPGN